MKESSCINAYVVGKVVGKVGKSARHKIYGTSFSTFSLAAPYSRQVIHLTHLKSYKLSRPQHLSHYLRTWFLCASSEVQLVHTLLSFTLFNLCIWAFLLYPFRLLLLSSMLLQACMHDYWAAFASLYA